MDLSERQIKLINYLFDFPEGVKMAQIEKELGASRRTIYRDIAELELLIHPMNLTIENTKHLFKIDGSSKGKKQLHEAIQIEFEEPSMLSIEQRQSAIAVELLSEIEPVKMQSFAIDFHTSVATISKDLVALEATFADYQILIKRQKSKGVGIEGTEFNIRNLLNAIIDSELGIYDFFQILANPEWKQSSKTTTKLFMNILGFENFTESYSLIRNFQQNQLSNVQGEQLKRLIVVLVVMLNRLKKRQMISDLPQFDHNKMLENQKLTLKIFLKLKPEIKRLITSLEVNYLTLQMEAVGIRTGQNNVLKDYNLPLSVSAKELIDQVSREMGWNFATDDDLFNEVMLVLENPLSLGDSTKNGALTEDENADLNISVLKKIKNLFTEITLSNQQIKLIQKLFQNAMSTGEKKRSLNVLIVCPNGMSTAQILKTRLNRRVDGIGKISVASTVTLTELEFDKYDLVLSTIDLSSLHIDYELVSPLLLNDEVEKVKKKVREKLIEKSNKVEPKKEDPRLNFDNFYQKTQEAHNFISEFDVTTVDNNGLTMAETLLKIVKQIGPEIVLDVNEVTGKLLRRLSVTPVGIPKSNLGLIHTISANVTRPYASIFELEDVVDFAAMDHSSIQLKRIVLIIGPEQMTEYENNLVGSISSLMIQSQAMLDLFNKGTKDQITDVMGKELLRVIKAES